MAEQGTRFPGLPVVLLVDDEPALLDSLGQELKGSCKLFTAASAEKADLLLAARRYDVVVCDHMLPGEQGLDFLEKIMEMMPSTRRGSSSPGTRAPSSSRAASAIAGLSACLVKPGQGRGNRRGNQDCARFLTAAAVPRLLARRKGAVALRGARISPARSPWKVISPPSGPPPGPSSTTWSASLIRSRLCSITATVWP